MIKMIVNSPKVGPIIAVLYPYAKAPQLTTMTMKTLYQLNFRFVDTWSVSLSPIVDVGGGCLGR